MILDRAAALFTGAFAAAAPLAVAALGGLLTEAAGSLSVALEGSMLAGAFAAAAVGQSAGSLSLGLAGAVLAGAFLGLLVGAAAGGLGADVFVAGLAANLLAPGAVSLLSQAFYGTKGVLPANALRTAEAKPSLFTDLPLLGRALFGQEALFYVLAAAAALLFLLYGRSVFGLRLRASGEGKEVARAVGIEPGRYRLAAHIIAGAASGLAGAALASHVAAFVPGMSSGRGWIALVAVYLGGRRPGGVLVACLGFGLLIALSNEAQGIFGGPAGTASAAAGTAELLQALPYVATAVALVAWKRAERKI